VDASRVHVVDRSLAHLLKDAINARQSMLDDTHEVAVRLFSGFSEGCPDLVIDLYATTAVLHNYADPPELGKPVVEAALAAVLDCLPWVCAVLIKNRSAAGQEERAGTLAFGDHPDECIREGDLLFAVNLRLHQDCSLYLDTRNARLWALENLSGKTVLNAFAYTGSLGVAALGGGASRVVQLDRSRRYLDIARRSYALNHFPIRKQDFLASDFFRETARMRRQHLTMDCVFLDPPFFSAGAGGVVDQENSVARLINKVRPLVAPGGCLVAINNAVYVSGAEYIHTLEALCKDGHMTVETLLPVPPDFSGILSVRGAAPISDPAPFNHSTKIAVLRMHENSVSG
jgi:23S rRNA (cytosine1962-C5)-methyltransferase